MGNFLTIASIHSPHVGRDKQNTSENQSLHLSRLIRPDNAPFPMLHIILMMDALPDKAEAEINDLLDEFCRKTVALLQENDLIVSIHPPILGGTLKNSEEQL